MLDLLNVNIIGELATKLGDDYSDVRLSAVQALSELAKHGENSDRRGVQTLMSNQTIRVTTC
jgi:hypothetical protein